MEGCPALTAPLIRSGAKWENEAQHVQILQLTGYRNRQETCLHNTWPTYSCNYFFYTVLLYTTDFTAVPLYKGVSLYLLLMSGSAPASRRHRTHDKCLQDTASSKAVCSCKVRLSTEPGWAGAEDVHIKHKPAGVTHLIFLRMFKQCTKTSPLQIVTMN